VKLDSIQENIDRQKKAPEILVSGAFLLCSTTIYLLSRGCILRLWQIVLVYTQVSR
jgi:hypothetical protein